MPSAIVVRLSRAERERLERRQCKDRDAAVVRRITGILVIGQRGLWQRHLPGERGRTGNR